MIRYTLLGDGSSDRTLLKIIKWILSDRLPNIPVTETFANFNFLHKPPRMLEERIIKALELWPCDILFIHRDAEQTKDIDDILKSRNNEIRIAALNAGCKYVAIIPVKMMETWLLTDEKAILKAAGNANNLIQLPKIIKLETLANPKEELHEQLKKASGLKGRRLDSFNVHQAVHLVAEHTTDFSSLRQLKAFKSFEEDLVLVLKELKYMD